MSDENEGEKVYWSHLNCPDHWGPCECIQEEPVNPPVRRGFRVVHWINLVRGNDTIN